MYWAIFAEFLGFGSAMAPDRSSHGIDSDDADIASPGKPTAMP